MEIQQGNTNMQTFFHFANIVKKITKYALIIAELISFMVVFLDMNLFINSYRRKQQHCKVCNSCVGEFKEDHSVSTFHLVALVF